MLEAESGWLNGERVQAETAVSGGWRSQAEAGGEVQRQHFVLLPTFSLRWQVPDGER